MRHSVKKLNVKSLLITVTLLVFISLVMVICSYAFGDQFTLRGDLPVSNAISQTEDFLEKYEALGIPLDPSAEVGMLDPKEKTGEKKPDGTVMYKISSTPTFKNGQALGKLNIENHADNQYLLKFRIDLENGETVYETGFLGPNMHITEDRLDVELEKGEYPALVTIEAYQVDKEQTFFNELPKKQEITIKING